MCFRWARFGNSKVTINIIITNNGTEAQNKPFKYEDLPRSIGKSIEGIATVLVPISITWTVL